MKPTETTTPQIAAPAASAAIVHASSRINTYEDALPILQAGLNSTEVSIKDETLNKLKIFFEGRIAKKAKFDERSGVSPVKRAITEKYASRSNMNRGATPASALATASKPAAGQILEDKNEASPS
jgi:hypothetical protein